MSASADRVTVELAAVEPRRGRGRPRQHADAAARQAAYRARLKQAGKRVVSVVVRDTRGGAPLRSDVLDLSEVRAWPKRA